MSEQTLRSEMLLGSDALGFARDYYAGRLRESDAWAELTASTDFAPEASQ